MTNKESVKVQRSIKKILKNNAGFIILLAGTIVLFSIFFLMTVDGESMTNTYQNGEKVICSRFFDLKHGDVIVCDIDARLEQGTVEKRLVKRVIAMEGDTVDIKDGKVYVNGNVLDEPYIREPMEYVPENSMIYPLIVPTGKLFVMGDNRNASHDSRDTRYGLVDRNRVVGKVIFSLDFTK